MDAPAIAQAKALDSKSSSPAKSVEAALPADKTVAAKVTQVTPDQAQSNSHKVKLEINGSLLQISAKFNGKPPEPGSSVSIVRSQSGQIQLTVNADQPITKTAVQAQPSTNSADNRKLQSATRSLLNNLSTPAPTTTSSSATTTTGQSVTLKAPVTINASGESLAIIEKSLPKGQPLLARVIDQGAPNKPVNIPNTATASTPQATLQSTNQPPLPIPNQSQAAHSSSNIQANLTQQNQALVNTRIAANTQLNPATNTQQPQTSTAANSQNTALPATNTASASTLNNTGSAPTPTANQQSPQLASQPATPITTPSSAPNLNIAPAASTPTNTSANLAAATISPQAAQTASPTLTPVPSQSQAQAQTASDTYSIKIVAPATQATSSAANSTNNLTNAASNIANPLPSQPAATPQPSSNNQNNLAPAGAPTSTSNPVAPSTVAASNTQAIATNNTLPQVTTPPQAAAPASTVSAQAPATPVSVNTATTNAPVTANPANNFSPAANPNASTTQSPQSYNTPINPQSSQATQSTLPTNAPGTTLTSAPQNAQLSSLANPTATLKIAVAGREVSLQAPANLPELKNVQITRIQGVQANIQWQQASPPSAQTVQPLTSLTPKQVTLVDQSLRQALPQQVPIAEGINQLVAQAAQLANTPSAVNSAVDKVALSIMQMFGVKPGAKNSSDTIKRNIQQGGLFTEAKLLNQGPQQGDMKSFLSQLSKLADQLPTEQREMLQNTADRMLARVTTNQLTHVQQQHVKTDISNERSFQIDIPVQSNEKLDNVEIEIKQRKHLNDEGDFVSIWSVKMHFDLEERGEVDAEVALNPTDNSISTTFLCTKLSTVQEIEQRIDGFRSQLNDHGFDVQTLHCTQGSQAASANNPISKRIIDIRT